MDSGRLPAEARARVLIDGQLVAAGWTVADLSGFNPYAPGWRCGRRGWLPGMGRVDYLLYLDQRIVGVIEAKPLGTPLTGVEWQSATYANGLTEQQRAVAVTVQGRLTYVFEASWSETHFTNGYDPEPPRRACRDGAVQVLHVRGTDRQGQDEPRHHLAEGRVSGRPRQPARPRGHRAGDRRRPDGGPRGVRGCRRGTGSICWRHDVREVPDCSRRRPYPGASQGSVRRYQRLWTVQLSPRHPRLGSHGDGGLLVCPGG